MRMMMMMMLMMMKKKNKKKMMTMKMMMMMSAVTDLTKHEMSDVHFLMTRADLFSSSWARDIVRPSSM